MSYILEALKKSQRDRELGQVPDLTAAPYADSSETRSGMSPWIISSVVMALVALLIALYGVFGRQQLEQQVSEIQTQTPMVKQPQSVEPVAAKIKDRTEAPAHPPEPILFNETKPEPKPRAVDKPEPIRQAAPPEKKATAQPPREEAPVLSTVSEPSSRQTEVERIRLEYAQMQAREKQRKQEKQLEKTPQHEQKAPAKTPAPAEPATEMAAPVKNAHPAVHELPAEVLSRLPPRNIILQSYSEDPAQRFVILNSVKLHQGESTADGLRVLEIRADGLLLGFEGYEFFQAR